MVAAGVGEDRLRGQGLGVDAGDVRGDAFAAHAADALADAGPLGGAVAGREQGAVGRPVHVVDVEADLDAVRRHGVRTPRQADDRLGRVAGDEVRPAVGSDLEAVGADALAAGHAGPVAARLPLPDVAGGGAGRREPALGQRHHRVQPEALRGHHAPDPGQGRDGAAGVDLEHLDRLAVRVADDVQRVGVAVTGPDADAVGPELLGGHAGAAAVTGHVVPAPRRGGRGGEQPDGAAVAAVGGRQVAVVHHARHDDPRRVGYLDEVLGADGPADELDVAVRLALRGGRRGHRQQGRDGHEEHGKQSPHDSSCRRGPGRRPGVVVCCRGARRESPHGLRRSCCSAGFTLDSQAAPRDRTGRGVAAPPARRAGRSLCRPHRLQGGTMRLVRAYAISCPRCSCMSPPTSIMIAGVLRS